MLLCDGHVHIHECFTIDNFLSSALKNFSTVVADLSFEKNSQFVLWLTESYGMSKFSELIQRQLNKPNNSQWCIQPTKEPFSLIARHDDGELILISGRQIVSAEKLEMLALGTCRDIKNGAPLTDTMKSINAANAIPVLPWGFGKWTWQRGKIVEDFINRYDDLWIGDNGGRLAGFAEPKLFSLARERKIPILPGSDPLPFPDESRRVASFGWAFDCTVSKQRPGEELKYMLRMREEIVATYGRLQSMVRFLQNQIKMQIIKRVRA